MNIMIDYDGTYTADFMMWRDLIGVMKDSGHSVYLVTSRSPDIEIEDVSWWKENSIPIVYCSFEAKQDVCLRSGIKIDIWIDNDPLYITEGFL
jgi:hypothetical protein